MKKLIQTLLREGLNSNVWYHGSNSKFDNFDNIDNRTYREIDVPSWYFTKDIEYAKSYGKYLYVVELNIKKIFDTTNKSHFKIFLRGLNEWGYSAEKIEEILSDEFVNGLPYWTCNDAIYIAAMNGFDAISVEEELARSVLGVAVFDATKIKILKSI